MSKQFFFRIKTSRQSMKFNSRVGYFNELFKSRMNIDIYSDGDLNEILISLPLKLILFDANLFNSCLFKY